MVFRSQYSFTYFFFIVFLIYIILFSCSVRYCHGSDRILRGQTLSGNKTLVSKGGKFELGFFTPGNSRNYYVGIWYKKIPIQTVVWVANRTNPISHSWNNGWRLQLSRNGNLQIVVLSEIIWDVETSNGTEAIILDTGNFVVRNATGHDIWKSFDHPTDTWLPGGTLEYNETDGSSIQLFSWKSQNDPSIGDYSLSTSVGLSIYLNDSQRIWSSSILQELLANSISISNDVFSSSYFNLTYFADAAVTGLSYDDAFNETMYSRIVVDNFGKLKYLTWSETIKKWEALWVQPSDPCTTSGFCGGNALCESHPLPNCSCLTGSRPKDQFNWDQDIFTGGCERGLLPRCPYKEKFEKYPNVVLPTNAVFLNVKEFKNCERECRDNCSCMAFAYSKELGCLIFGGELLGITKLANNSGQADLYIKTDAQSSGGLSTTGRVLVVLAGAAILILVTIFLWYFWRKHTSKVSQPQPEAHQNLLLLDLNSGGSENNNNSLGEEKDNKYELPTFSFSSIAAATNDFSITHKLGQGGFGPVYKGELLNGQFVAVKRLSKRSGQGLEEFKNEMELIAKLQHRNLVGILGCCIENDEKILVYEYMPNKSLDFFLYDAIKKEQLDWERRVHIIEGIAQGLQYLHHHSRLRIVHRDLKVGNILLDAEMNPKISDFGMARIFGGSDSQANTHRIVGTYGYMSPEYAMGGVFSIKSDVYAFGVLLLEIISGKKNTGFYGSDELNLLGYAWNLWTNNRGLELIDPVMKIHSSLTSIALRYIQIGLLCVQENPGDRPVMSDVVAMLNKEQIPVALPQQPAFTVGRTLIKATPEQNEVHVCSVNDLTVSLMEAR